LKEAVAAICKTHGLSFEVKGGKYNAECFSLGFEFRVARDHAEEGDRAEFGLHAHLYGLTPDDFGRRFSSNGRFYAVIGFMPRNRKYPVLARDDSGSRYKFPSAVLEDLE
jgi:hypothetical protein